MPPDTTAQLVFPSRIDAWLAAVVLLAVLSPLAVVAVQGAGSGVEQVVVWAMALLPLLAGGLLLLPCRYTLADDHLHIRCGLIRQRIAYRDITGDASVRTVLTFHATGEELLALTHAGLPFYKPPWSGTVVGLVLDDDTDWAEVAELVTESYRHCAPQKLVRLLEDG